MVVLLLLMVLTAPNVFAHERHYVWNAEYQTLPQGTFEIESYTTSKVPDFKKTNANILNGFSQVSVAISAPTPTITKQTTPIPTVSVSPSLTPEVSAEPQAQANQGGLFATIGGAMTLGTGNKWLGGFVVLAVVVAGYYLVKKISRKFKNKRS